MINILELKEIYKLKNHLIKSRQKALFSMHVWLRHHHFGHYRSNVVVMVDLTTLFSLSILIFEFERMQVHTTKQTNSKTKPYKMNINFLSVSIDSNIKRRQ